MDTWPMVQDHRHQILDCISVVKLTLRLAGYCRRGNICAQDCVTEVKEHDRTDKGSKDG